MSIEYKVFTESELNDDDIDQLIAAKASFRVMVVDSSRKLAKLIEARVEKAGLRSRVYVEYRTVPITGAMFSPIALWGVGAAVGVLAHNLVTFNPDYEIGKNKATGDVTVTYKK